MTLETPQIAQAIQLIESRIGLSATTLERIGLSLILQQASSGDVENYLRQLQSTDEHSPAWQRLIYALTIGETYFLRDSSHFNILRENILPRMLLQRRQQNDLRLNIWVVGCATGEEAYSIATTLTEHVPDLSAWRINLYATDINQRAIDSAYAACLQTALFHASRGWLAAFLQHSKNGHVFADECAKRHANATSRYYFLPPCADVF
jgi:chemotaxis methyl-accepting protein methylase